MAVYLYSSFKKLYGSVVFFLQTETVAHGAPGLRAGSFEVDKLLSEWRELHVTLQVPQRSAVDLHAEQTVWMQVAHLFERLNTLKNNNQLVTLYSNQTTNVVNTG